MREMKEKIGFTTEPLDTIMLASDIAGWFAKQASVGAHAWFLAHADDGVIWGEVRNGALVLSGDIFIEASPLLRPETLQQARLFGDKAEVRVWRVDRAFCACRVEEQTCEDGEAFDERHILWGTQGESKAGFTLLSDGRQGLLHAVPIDVPNKCFDQNESRYRPVGLTARHYLRYEDDGQVYIALHRLLSIDIQKKV